MAADLAETLRALQATASARIQAYDTHRAAQRVQDAALRGAMAGVVTRGGLHLVTFVLHLLTRRKKPPAGGQPDVRTMLQDTARWAAFLGSFSGVFVAADEAIACLGGRRRTRAWRAMAAGTLAGPTMLLAGSEQAHTSLALYLAIRGITLLVRCGNLPDAHPLKRKLLAPTRWEHGDVALMCLATSQLAYSWIVLPQTLPTSFVRFLNKHGGKPLHVYDAVREMSERASAGLKPGHLAALAGTNKAWFCGGISCQLVHPGQTCSQHALEFFPPAYLRALPVYFPVYVIPAILVHRKKLLSPSKAPTLWRKMALGIARSSLFLSLYCTLAWRGACGGFNLAGRTTGAVLGASCWIAGLAVLVEKPSRRMELALYLLARAAESFALSLAAWGVVRPSSLPRRLDVLLFSLAAGWILHCYSDHFGERRDVFRSSYLAVFDFILGNTGFSQASISHQPSNAELVMRSVRSMSNLLQRGSGNGGGRSRRGSGSGAWSAGTSPALTPLLTPRDVSAEEAAEGASAASSGGGKQAPVVQPGSSGSRSGGVSGGSGSKGAAASVVEAMRAACLAYDRAAKTQPVLTKALTSFVGFAIGDRIAQSVVAGPYDPFRCLRLSLYGLLIDGTAGHFFYQFLDKNVCPDAPTSNKAVLIKMALDQLLYGPIMTLVFFAFLKTLEGRPDLILHTIETKLWPVLAANYALWPIAHLINFKYVPTDWRILFNNVVALGWTTYLSFTCGPASGGAAGSDGAAAAAAASALLSAIPCSKVPGALHNPGLAEAAQQVAAFQQMLAAWGTKILHLCTSACRACRLTSWWSGSA
ncbi:hypothetical protein C2E21_4128 [Chlorella sorokiniana]|uniref:Transmembrane protein 135 N-terminal domain-containing protein n=1 Tax=Chlorella sorokiniana TaxID=3076 RepID=A0A2P6TSJ2_CHLSO|nr:hypothetical protein C2E21_4128 [Chlorella sorokiniana]|eukprot:PRW57029.1 hypothetical protein C2E21_4128 [Chlorella sorokiniana]